MEYDKCDQPYGVWMIGVCTACSSAVIAKENKVSMGPLSRSIKSIECRIFFFKSTRMDRKLRD
jgi:hypothetical protein